MKGEGNRPLFAFAGLWRHFRGNYRNKLAEFDTHTILTTKPNAVVKPIHPTRMSVILSQTDWEQWLTGTKDEASALLKPLPAERMEVKVIAGPADKA